MNLHFMSAGIDRAPLHAQSDVAGKFDGILFVAVAGAMVRNQLVAGARLKSFFPALYSKGCCAIFDGNGEPGQVTEVVMLTKRSGLIPALLLFAAMLAVLADPVPAATLLLF